MNYNAARDCGCDAMKAKAQVIEQRSPAVPQRDDHHAFIAAIGRLVRLSRAKRGMTRRLSRRLRVPRSAIWRRSKAGRAIRP